MLFGRTLDTTVMQITKVQWLLLVFSATSNTCTVEERKRWWKKNIGSKKWRKNRFYHVSSASAGRRNCEIVEVAWPEDSRWRDTRTGIPIGWGIVCAYAHDRVVYTRTRCVIGSLVSSTAAISAACRRQRNAVSSQGQYNDTAKSAGGGDRGKRNNRVLRRRTHHWVKLSCFCFRTSFRFFSTDQPVLNISAFISTLKHDYFL